MTKHLGALLVDGLLELEQLADALWLTQHLPPGVSLRPLASEEQAHRMASEPGAHSEPPQPKQQPEGHAQPTTTANQSSVHVSEERPGSVEVAPAIAKTGAQGREHRFWSPGAPPLTGRTQLGRALRPLGWSVPRPDEVRVVEDATAERIASTGLWAPVTEPQLEPGLDLVIVVDADARLRPWRELTRALIGVVRSSGRLRNLTVWTIDGHTPACVLRPGGGGTPRGPRHLLDPTGRSAVLVISDFAGILWREGEGLACLQGWGRRLSTTLLSLLPERLWERSVLGQLSSLTVGTSHRAQPGTGLRADPLVDAAGLALPVVTIEPMSMNAWAALVAGDTRARLRGVAVLPDPSFETRLAARVRALQRSELRLSQEEVNELAEEMRAHLSGEDAPLDEVTRVEHFRRNSAPSVVRLAAALACAPLRLDVMRLVQRAVVPSSGPLELAEILGSGLFNLRPGGGVRDDSVWFDVDPSVRRKLAVLAAKRESVGVLELVGRYIREHLPGGYDFEAMILDPDRETEQPPEELRPFAELYADELDRLGGKYRAQAQRLRGAKPREKPKGDSQIANQPFRDLWIMVAGDGEPDEANRAAADAVGEALGRAGYGVVTCGWAGVDEVAARGFMRALTSEGGSTSQFRERLIQVSKRNEVVAFPEGRRVIVDSFEAEYTESLMHSFAVIVIGGKSGTRRVVARASEVGVPVLAFANTGGQAAKLLARLPPGPRRSHRDQAAELIAELETLSNGEAFCNVMGSRYEKLRGSYDSGSQRTRLMEGLIDIVLRQLRRDPQLARLETKLYGSGRDGARVVAIACCAGNPMLASVDVIADAIAAPRSPFEQWWALNAAFEVTRALSPLAVEPCIAATIGQLDRKDSMINSREDASRYVRGRDLIVLFGRKLGAEESLWERTARAWVSAGVVRVPGRQLAIFGGDPDGAYREMCVALGWELARGGWSVAAGYGVNVGPVIVDAFRSAGGTPERANLVDASKLSDAQAACRKILEGANAVIIVGGGRTTAMEARIAQEMGVPVLGLGFTGGVAETVSRDYRGDLIEQGAPAELLFLLDGSRAGRLPVETVIRILNGLVAEMPDAFRLRNAAETRGWLEKAGHCRSDDIIELLNIFASRKQRTWLAFLPQRVLCILDDTDTRRKDSAVQFESKPAELLPVRTDSLARAPDNGTTRVLVMGKRRRWLYSTALFPDPDTLVRRATQLIETSRAALGLREESASARVEEAARGDGISGYFREMRKTSGYHGVWPVGEPSELGDIGVLRDGRFVKMTTLAQLGIAYELRDATDAGNLELSWATELMRSKSTPESSLVYLRERGAFLLHARGCRTRSIVDTDALGRALLEWRRVNTWRADWCVVHELVSAEVATLLIGVSRAQIELRRPPNAPKNLAMGSEDLSLQHSDGSAITLLGVRGLNPLYRLSRLARNLVGRWRFELDV